eukprot:CAMPEP_0174713120 /NCGR_PEP_ID=MMETSP1094-20130205/13898_1 /TAXON_ID=156173 /ORGANISM="Chrysochromulina brevifilum, Strain UTEX LB 985" /LENGTH=96 /DNA_ID=CAMNT_0015912273 /DNA_START=748 /DNA_END=1036 /DNA_ORIENTATION=-
MTAAGTGGQPVEDIDGKQGANAQLRTPPAEDAPMATRPMKASLYGLLLSSVALRAVMVERKEGAWYTGVRTNAANAARDSAYSGASKGLDSDAQSG